DELAEIRNQKIGFVFQGFNLLSRTSALENVQLPLIYGQILSKRRKEMAEQALSAVGLEGRAHHHPSQLSGGEQQRVAIARAMVTKPLVLLADEPTGNLDRATGQNVAQLLWDLNQNTGIALVLVTHNQEIAQRAQRTLELKDGKLWTK
ncbi:MAG: ATP-binding cassette domain-containing protein, partial [bacterium]|nr:ATP-binding cassette domain-containing protein [bacterium]